MERGQDWDGTKSHIVSMCITMRRSKIYLPNYNSIIAEQFQDHLIIMHIHYVTIQSCLYMIVIMWPFSMYNIFHLPVYYNLFHRRAGANQLHCTTGTIFLFY